jgi:hypothetical protein
MRAFVSVIFVACCVSYLNAAAVEIIKSDDKSVQSDVKQEKRSLSHGTVETSPIQITSAGVAGSSYDQGWAPQPEAGWAPAPQIPVSAPLPVYGSGPQIPILSQGPQIPVLAQGPQVVATNTDTLTTIQQKIPVPYPVIKTVPVDRPVPQPYPVEVIKHVPQPYPVVK